MSTKRAKKHKELVGHEREMKRRLRQNDNMRLLIKAKVLKRVQRDVHLLYRVRCNSDYYACLWAGCDNARQRIEYALRYSETTEV